MELSKDDNKLVQRIKKLFQSRDLIQIEEGIRLAQEANSAAIFDELIGDVSYKDVRFTSDWKGTSNDNYYFSVALMGLINYAPKGSKGQVYRDTITSIIISGSNNHYANGVITPQRIYAKHLSNFSNLKTLVLDRFEEIVGLEEIYHLPLEVLEISNFIRPNSYGSKEVKERNGFPKTNEKWGFKQLRSLKLNLPSDPELPNSIVEHLDFISEITTLRSLEVDAKHHRYGETVKPNEFSIQGISTLVNLEYLRIKANMRTIDALSSMKALKYLKIESKLLTHATGISSDLLEMALFINCVELIDISGISNAVNLEYLYFVECSKLCDLKPLSATKKLKILDLRASSVEHLEGLENAENLIALGLSQTPLIDLDAITNLSKIKYIDAQKCGKLKSIVGLQNNVNLREIDLSNCISLESLEGLNDCKELVSININDSKIQNLTPLMNCSKIFQNDTWNLNDEEFNRVKERFAEIVSTMHKLEESKKIWFSYENSLLNKGGRSNYARDIYTDRNWNDPVLKEFSIENCPDLVSIEGLKNTGVQILKLSNCPKLKNVDYLSQFSSLRCCDFSDCIQLESVESLAALPKMDRLFLRNCSKVKPKPRFTVMDSIEKLNDYLSNFRKNTPKVEISKEKKDINDKLQDLLLSEDYVQINLGLELISSISDLEIFSYLLHGVQIVNNEPTANSIFLSSNRNKDFRTYALEGLLCVAPKEIEVAQQYRSAIVEKSIYGFENMSLLPISQLENLVTLTVSSTKITVLTDTKRLQKLENLKLSNNLDLKELSGIKELKNLKTLEIHNCGITNLDDLSDLLNLVDLKITLCPYLTTTNGMLNLPALERIDLDKNAAINNIDSLGTMVKLKEISLNDCPSIQSIKSLVNLPELRILKLNNHNLRSLDDVSQLMKPLAEGLRK